MSGSSSAATASAPLSDAESLKHAEVHVAQLLEKSPFYSLTIASIRPVYAHCVQPGQSGPAGRVVCHLPVEPHHLNSKGSLHGSLTATLVDFAGGVSIACAADREGIRRGHDTGVSVDLTIQYIGGAREGDTLEIEAIAERVGGSLAFTRVSIRKSDAAAGPGAGDLVATASHTKFVRRKIAAS